MHHISQLSIFALNHGTFVGTHFTSITYYCTKKHCYRQPVNWHSGLFTILFKTMSVTYTMYVCTIYLRNSVHTFSTTACLFHITDTTMPPITVSPTIYSLIFFCCILVFLFIRSGGSKLPLCKVWKKKKITQIYDGLCKKERIRSNEPCHEIMVLFILRKLILQMCMCSYPVGLDIWFLVGPFIYFHTSAKALAICTGSPGTSLVTYVISTIISWAGSNVISMN